jgi:rhamnosyltransferase subunit B
MQKKKHFVFAVIGSYGDFLPCFKLATSLKSRGYQVSFFTNDSFSKSLKDSNINFYSLGDIETSDKCFSKAVWVKDADLIFYKYFIEPNLKTLRAFIAKLKGEEIVILYRESTAFIADIASEDNKNVQTLYVHLSPYSFQSLANNPLFKEKAQTNISFKATKNIWNFYSQKIFGHYAIPSLNKVRQELGLELITDFHDYLKNDSRIHLTLFPRWFAKKEIDWPKNIIYGDFLLGAMSDSPLENNVKKFLSSGLPPILITMGSFIYGTLHENEKYLFELSEKITKKLGLRFIFISNTLKIKLDKTENNFLVAKSLSLHELLPKVKGIIHHGGIGTSAFALNSGIPQLSIPQGADQFTNARLIEGLGVGLEIKFEQLNEENYESAIKQLIADKKIEKNCMKFANKFKTSLSLDDITDKILSKI